MSVSAACTRTALAVNTNSPSDNLAGTESEVPVPGQDLTSRVHHNP